MYIHYYPSISKINPIHIPQVLDLSQHHLPRAVLPALGVDHLTRDAIDDDATGIAWPQGGAWWWVDQEKCWVSRSFMAVELRNMVVEWDLVKKVVEWDWIQENWWLNGIWATQKIQESQTLLLPNFDPRVPEKVWFDGLLFPSGSDSWIARNSWLSIISYIVPAQLSVGRHWLAWFGDNSLHLRKLYIWKHQSASGSACLRGVELGPWRRRLCATAVVGLAQRELPGRRVAGLILRPVHIEWHKLTHNMVD